MPNTFDLEAQSTNGGSVGMTDFFAPPKPTVVVSPTSETSLLHPQITQNNSSTFCDFMHCCCSLTSESLSKLCEMFCVCITPCLWDEEIKKDIGKLFIAIFGCLVLALAVMSFGAMIASISDGEKPEQKQEGANYYPFV